MASIADHMAGMASGKRGGGVSEHMERPEHKDGPDGADGVHGHLKALHSIMGGGKHMHIQQHDHGGYTTHHVHEDGSVKGPHEHGSHEEMKDHMDRFFNEEEHEPAHEDGDGLY